MILTPWGELEVSDAHVHFFSPAFFESLAQQKQLPVSEIGESLKWSVPESLEYLADRWVIELNHHGVDSAIVIASITGDFDSVGFAVDRHPNRFRAVAMVNPTNTGSDMRRVQALDDGQIQGVFLFPAMHRYSMHDTHVKSLISTVAGHPRGSVVYVHCGELSVGFRRKLGLPCPFDMRYSNPIDLHEVLLEFPHVPFIIPHFGAGYFREALMLADLCPNVYFDTSSSNKWLATQPGRMDLAEAFRQALDVLGPRRLLFGSDSSWFPRGWTQNIFETQVQALSSLGVDKEAAAAIFGGNLRTLFQFRTT